MIKITSRKGKWNKEFHERELFWEECPNPECPTKELNYPEFMKTPHCPDCQTLLPGQTAQLNAGADQRIAWHMEEE